MEAQPPCACPLLEARRLCRRQDRRWLLTEITMEIRAGDRLAVVGSTGSGKTVLLRALAMLDAVDTGQLLWHGREVSGREVPRFRGCVVYLHQRPALIEGTVEENLRQPLNLGTHRGRAFDRDAHRSRLTVMNRDESFFALRQRDLSGGEVQIVALLRALQLEPEVLLLDEPSSALDAQAREGFERLVQDWYRESPDRRAAVWVTHDPRQADRVADHVLRMKDGRLSRDV